MQRYAADDLKFTYSGEHDPIGTVSPGERFVVETEDCFTGRFRTPAGFTPENLRWVLENLDGVTGPIRVDGAEPGHAVAVTLHEVAVTTPGSVAWSRCEAGTPSEWWNEWYASDGLPIENGAIVVGDVRIPTRPVVGCIATAPDRETVLSKMQGPYGGNMDCNEVAAGATVILPVNVPGAYLYFGDAKARMGDGEIVQAPEVGTEITATVEILPRPAGMGWPRIESATHRTTVVSGLSIDQIGGVAFAELLGWAEETSGMSRADTALVLGMLAEVGVCQIANTFHTAKCTVERALLPWA